MSGNIHYREINVTEEGDPPCLVLEFANEDLRNPHHISALEGELADVMAQTSLGRVVIDFNRVTVAPSAVLGLTVQVVADASNRSMQVRLCGMTPPIRKVFELIGTRLMVPIVDNRRIALAAEWDQTRAINKKSGKKNRSTGLFKRLFGRSPGKK